MMASCHLERWLLMLIIDRPISRLSTSYPISCKIYRAFVCTISGKLVHSLFPSRFAEFFCLLLWRHLLCTVKVIVILPLFNPTHLLWLWETLASSETICKWCLESWSSGKLLGMIGSIFICCWNILCVLGLRFPDWWLLIIKIRWRSFFK